MASIEAKVDTPMVANFLKVTFPGRERPAMLPLSSFTDEELRRVGNEYTEALIARAEVQRKNGAPEPKPRKRAPRAAE